MRQLTVDWAARTDRGLRRQANEDSYCARPDLGLFVVADGMGGHAAGEVASRVSVDAIEEAIAAEADGGREPGEPATLSRADRLRAAFASANQRIAERTASDPALRGMATTASAVWVGRDGLILVGHVGDSRIYLWRDGRMERVTLDHSWVEEQVRAGALHPSDARQHPWRNVVTRALAGGTDPQVDVFDLVVRPGDRLLICSDGLSSVVSDERLGRALAQRLTPERTCDDLVALANAEGGPDNITVVALDVHAA
jgi:protein phosphatase